MPSIPLLLGHRGLRASRAQLLTKLFRRLPPENSFAAFDLALDQGAHGFEFDVRRTSDNKAVLCHDAMVERLRVAESTLHELRRAIPHLVTLDEVLARYGQRSFLNPELKVSGLEKQTIELVHQYCTPEMYVVSCFLPDVLESLAKLDSRIALGHIFNQRQNAGRWRDLPVRYVFPSQPLASEHLIEQAIKAGKRVIPWTVNSPRQMRHFINCGVNGLITDDPALVVRTAMQHTRPELTPAD
jgi:glycerophosphoryl diester phosphodiesterase